MFALALRARGTGPFAIGDGAPARSLEILELAGAQGPQEGAEAQEPEEQRGWNEPDQRHHGALSTFAAGLSESRIVRSRKAFPVTATDDSDMASAASNGVTSPAMASGTNTAL